MPSSLKKYCGSWFSFELVIDLFLWELIFHTSFHTGSFFPNCFIFWTILNGNSPSLINKHLTALSPLHQGCSGSVSGGCVHLFPAPLLWWWLEAGRLPGLLCMLKVVLAAVWLKIWKLLSCVSKGKRSSVTWIDNKKHIQ